MNYYCNMKRYDEKGRRVAIFGVPFSIGEFDAHTNSAHSLHIEVFPCSKKDQFNKKLAKQAFEEARQEFHPLRINIEMKDPRRPKWSFLMWCKENYYGIRKEIVPFSGELISANISLQSRKLSGLKALEIKTLQKI